jgi:hypothetical protein
LIMELKRAQRNDFEVIYPFLKRVDPAANITKETWKRIFDPQWPLGEDYCGYYLAENSKVIGFLGYIFCSREINGRVEKFCNMTTWYVDERYRAQSLSLLYPFLSLEGYTLTNFTASGRVNEILKKVGFRSLENEYCIFQANPVAAIIKRKKASLAFDGPGFELLLGVKEKRIYFDHKPYGCLHVLIKSNIGDCYLVMSRFKKQNKPFLVVRYLGDIDVFLSCSGGILLKMLLRLKAAYIQCDKRLLRGKRFGFTSFRKAEVEKVYRSNSIGPYDIDNLYSELILLGIL